MSRAWATRILVRACHDQLRRDRRAAPGLRVLSESIAPDPTGAITNREEMERAFRRLNAEQRAVIVLQYYRDLSLPEIAEALGIPLGTVRSRAHYAKRILRAAIEADSRPTIEETGRPMNVEHDTDRELRAWASEGVDTAPERFVWAALDQIERVPQRAAWRARLDGLAIRLRPAAGLVGTAAVAIVAVAILSRAVGPGIGTGDRRDYVMADLPGIVLWEDTKPATWTLDNLVSNPHDILEIPIRSMTETEMGDLPEPNGYVGGRYTNFSGPGGAGLFMSWGALFESEADAAAALPFFQHELDSVDGWGLGAGVQLDLGDEGWRYAGETTAFTLPREGAPIPADTYLWRNGNLLLAVGGWFTFDPDEVLAAAEDMDRRAEAAATIR